MRGISNCFSILVILSILLWTWVTTSFGSPRFRLSALQDSERYHPSSGIIYSAHFMIPLHPGIAQMRFTKLQDFTTIYMLKRQWRPIFPKDNAFSEALNSPRVVTAYTEDQILSGGISPTCCTFTTFGGPGCHRRWLADQVSQEPRTGSTSLRMMISSRSCSCIRRPPRAEAASKHSHTTFPRPSSENL
jgi:hypothetical protein